MNRRPTWFKPTWDHFCIMWGTIARLYADGIGPKPIVTFLREWGTDTPSLLIMRLVTKLGADPDETLLEHAVYLADQLRIALRSLR